MPRFNIDRVRQKIGSICALLRLISSRKKSKIKKQKGGILVYFVIQCFFQDEA